MSERKPEACPEAAASCAGFRNITEWNSMSTSGIIFPVSGPGEAHHLNERKDGYRIMMNFTGLWLVCDPCLVPYWFENTKE